MSDRTYGGMAYNQKPEPVPRVDSDDPWRHRSMGMRCVTCMFYVEKQVSGGVDPGSVHGALGRCRRHAPTMSGFPAVFERDWCGDHKLDENRI